MIFKRLAVILHVEIRVSQLTIDRAHGFEIFSSDSASSLKELDAQFTVTGFAQALALQRQLKAGRFAFPRRHCGEKRDISKVQIQRRMKVNE